ncbi:MAG: hypothetical protein KKF33_07130 [Alphaproteobacteria bacterium]|jgi:hypothetical protein|nr:hypothetical protein [Alphaproteobacteria bacterium]
MYSHAHRHRRRVMLLALVIALAGAILTTMIVLPKAKTEDMARAAVVIEMPRAFGGDCRAMTASTSGVLSAIQLATG